MSLKPDPRLKRMLNRRCDIQSAIKADEDEVLWEVRMDWLDQLKSYETVDLNYADEIRSAVKRLRRQCEATVDDDVRRAQTRERVRRHRERKRAGPGLFD